MGESVFMKLPTVSAPAEIVASHKISEGALASKGNLLRKAGWNRSAD
jgi:hypothetical protein